MISLFKRGTGVLTHGSKINKTRALAKEVNRIESNRILERGARY
jgi:hypothetical protein